MKQYIIPIGVAVLFAACSPAPPNVDLFEAASKGNLDAIKKHIAAGTDLNQKDPNPTGNKDDALGMAAAFGHTNVAKALIEAGADINSRNKNGDTPLHISSFLCYTEIVQSLLDKGADKNARNNAGSKPLDGVAMPWEDAKGIYDFLNGVLFKPIGIPLDYDRIKSTRPEIADILR